MLDQTLMRLTPVGSFCFRIPCCALQRSMRTRQLACHVQIHKRTLSWCGFICSTFFVGCQMESCELLTGGCRLARTSQVVQRGATRTTRVRSPGIPCTMLPLLKAERDQLWYTHFQLCLYFVNHLGCIGGGKVCRLPQL